MAKKNITKAEISRVMSAMGRKGGSAQVSKGVGKLTPEERQARAKTAAAKRWGKPTGEKSADES